MVESYYNYERLKPTSIKIKRWFCESKEDRNTTRRGGGVIIDDSSLYPKINKFVVPR